VKSASLLAVLLLGCSHDPPPAVESSRSVAPVATGETREAPELPASASHSAEKIPIRATGSVEGKPFDIKCVTLSSNLGDDDSAMLARAGGQAFLSCADPTQGVAVNATILTAPGDAVPQKNEENGRLGVLTYDPQKKDAGFADIVTTSSQSRPTAHIASGKISITRWDASAKHLVGTATMSWDKDNSGKPGSLRIEFDVTLATQ
jgi:hypothetical protein